MFKYLWIVILVLAVVGSISYVVWTIRDVIKKYEPKDLKDFYKSYLYDHNLLGFLLPIILGLAVTLLFIGSLCSFCNTFE